MAPNSALLAQTARLAQGPWLKATGFFISNEG